MPTTRFSPLLSLLQSGKALTYNDVLKAWPDSPHYASYCGQPVYPELKACVDAGLLVEGTRRGLGTWKLAKGARA